MHGDDEALAGAAGLAVENDVVYWTDYGRNRLWRYAGATAELIATDLEAPMGLAIHGDSLLVATATAISSVRTSD